MLTMFLNLFLFWIFFLIFFFFVFFPCVRTTYITTDALFQFEQYVPGRPWPCQNNVIFFVFVRLIRGRREITEPAVMYSGQERKSHTVSGHSVITQAVTFDLKLKPQSFSNSKIYIIIMCSCHSPDSLAWPHMLRRLKDGCNRDDRQVGRGCVVRCVRWLWTFSYSLLEYFLTCVLLFTLYIVQKTAVVY